MECTFFQIPESNARTCIVSHRDHGEGKIGKLAHIQSHEDRDHDVGIDRASSTITSCDVTIISFQI